MKNREFLEISFIYIYAKIKEFSYDLLGFTEIFK